METSSAGRRQLSFSGSIYGKLLVTGLLIVILQVPIVYIQSIISDRTNTKSEAENFIAQLSGKHQTFAPPILTVPYIYRYLDDKQRQRSYRTYAYILPDSLNIASSVEVEKRYRGIFELPVYEAKLTVKGSFTSTAVTPPDVAAEDILWNEAAISVGISDPRTIRDASPLSWDEMTQEPEPGTAGNLFGLNGIHYPVHLPSAAALSTAHHFGMTIVLGGSQTLNFLPVGRTTEIALNSTWPNPSFIGNYLPGSRTVTGKGFTAAWKILDLGRNFPRQLYNNQQAEKAPIFSSSQFGVGFYAPIDAHRMSERAIKYELLVIGLTFLVFLLFELFCELRIHTLQYLLIGAALVLFYLLLLSLAEHIGFSAAYFAASLTVLCLVIGYSRSVLRRSSGAATVGLALGLLYGFFYTLLQEQDYSLLIGTLGLTAILAAVMYLTRNIDWFQMPMSPQYYGMLDREGESAGSV